MKLRRLTISNIASIEHGEIDFLKDLTPTGASTPSPFFLIYGDTGAGKTVILDAISLALYKRTPRVEGVSALKNNDFTNIDGASVKIKSIEQYTRLGISPSSKSFSEVEFEGTDGHIYTARLTLGLKQKGAIGYATPKWTMKVDNEDWKEVKKDSALELEQAIGLSFEQFSRMAMLAQGEFASFLTGQKTEREAILEKLTDTQHFTNYGEAIKKIYERYKAAYDAANKEYQMYADKVLSEDERKTKEELSANLEAEKKQLDDQIRALEERRRTVESLSSATEAAATADNEINTLLRQKAEPSYQEAAALVESWDNTDEQRHKLRNKKEALKKAAEARLRLRNLGETFEALDADLMWRKESISRLRTQLSEEKAWEKSHEELLAICCRHQAIDGKIRNYEEKTDEATQIAGQIKAEKERTVSLSEALKCSTAALRVAHEAEEVKQKEIDNLENVISSLNKAGCEENQKKADAEIKSLTDIRGAMRENKAIDDRMLALGEEITAIGESSGRLRGVCDSLRSERDRLQREKETAEGYLTMMKISVEDMMVSLRRKLSQENAECCPLCGAHREDMHIDEDFDRLLLPCEEKAAAAQNEYALAESRLKTAEAEYNSAAGSLSSLNSQLEKMKSEKESRRKLLQEKMSASGLDADADETAITELITQSEKRRGDAESVLKKIADNGEILKRLLKEKNDLGTITSKAASDETASRAVLEACYGRISTLEERKSSLLAALTELKDEITGMVRTVYPLWDADTAATRKAMAADAAEVAVHTAAIAAAEGSLRLEDATMAAILDLRDSLCADHPDWKSAEMAVRRDTKNIQNEWAKLNSDAENAVRVIADAEVAVKDSDESLRNFFAPDEADEDWLSRLDAAGASVKECRALITETEKKLQSRLDARNEAQTKAASYRNALGLSETDPVPDVALYQEQGAELSTKRDAVSVEIGTIINVLEADSHNHSKAIEKCEAKEKALAVKQRWERLNNTFGGARFRTLVQSHILRPLLDNANIYLRRITDQYVLRCSEDNEQLAILVEDRYNKNQLRSSTILSGGERFMVSLALSLALSSLNRPDMNVDILFIDEGFGTLDARTLDSVMDTLTSLPELTGSASRRVGLISHREELYDRIPVRICVERVGEGRSRISFDHER